MNAISLPRLDWLFSIFRSDPGRMSVETTHQLRESADRAARAIRSGNLDLAEWLLAENGPAALRDAASLNLLAVLALSSGDWQTAKRFWTRACQRDPHYVPASQNLRRYFELCTFGTSKQPLSLGDERRCENSRSRELL